MSSSEEEWAPSEDGDERVPGFENLHVVSTVEYPADEEDTLVEMYLGKDPVTGTLYLVQVNHETESSAKLTGIECNDFRHKLCAAKGIDADMDKETADTVFLAEVGGIPEVLEIFDKEEAARLTKRKKPVKEQEEKKKPKTVTKKVKEEESEEEKQSVKTEADSKKMVNGDAAETKAPTKKEMAAKKLPVEKVAEKTPCEKVEVAPKKQAKKKATAKKTVAGKKQGTLGSKKFQGLKKQMSLAQHKIVKSKMSPSVEKKRQEASAGVEIGASEAEMPVVPHGKTVGEKPSVTVDEASKKRKRETVETTELSSQSVGGDAFQWQLTLNGTTLASLQSTIASFPGAE